MTHHDNKYDEGNPNIELLDKMADLVDRAGLTPSYACAWVSETRAYLPSVESQPYCLGHPKMEVQFNRATGLVQYDGKVTHIDMI